MKGRFLFICVTSGRDGDLLHDRVLCVRHPKALLALFTAPLSNAQRRGKWGHKLKKFPPRYSFARRTYRHRGLFY